MAHNEHHLVQVAARRDKLQEFQKFHAENRSSGLHSVRWVRRNRRSWTNSARQDCILQLKICIIAAAAMVCGCRTELTTSFSFDDNFVASNFTILQDASMAAGHIDLNSNGAYKNEESRGRALYNKLVQFLEPATNSVASFQTSFSFTIFARENSSRGDGFAFGLFPDVTSVGDSGKFMGILPFINTTGNNTIVNGSYQLPPGFANTFVVEFDTNLDVEFGDPSDNHVGLNWNSMVSLNATDLTASGLDLVAGNITAWIEYSAAFRKLSVWMTASDQNITNPPKFDPVLEVRDLDLSQLLLPSMYVGFAGAIAAGENVQHTINSWTFNSAFYSNENEGRPFYSKASSMDCNGSCKSKRTKRTVLIIGVCLGLGVCLITVSAFCFLRWRRRRRNATKASMILNLNPIFHGSPLQEQKPSSPPASLGTDPLNSTRASLSSKAFSPRVSLFGSKYLNSPRASLSPRQINSPRGSSLSSRPIFSPRAALGPNPFSPRASLNRFTPLREPMRKITSMDSLRSKHSRNGSGAGSKRFATTQELDAVSSIGPRSYTYRELKVATNSFQETLGQGGFGTVYKGYLPNHIEGRICVAVKVVAADSKQGEREFLAEVSIIAGLRHRHLVQMQGWCHEKGKLLLIYDYMENGSLDKYLYGTNPGDYPVLSWNVRYKALCQVASALTYLHDEVEQKVIHRDVKASNVLLDSKFNARLGDFGLARLSEHSQVADTTTMAGTADTTVMAGTMGYLAPELVHTGKATTKSDVFSFGTLILEVMCAKRPLDVSRPQRQALLGDWVWGCREAGRLLDTVDPRLARQYDDTKMTRALEVGLMCLHPDQTCRPPIRYALQMLVGDLALPTLPTHKPTISFGSGTLLIPMEDLLASSMSTIAAAMETPTTTKTALEVAEFEAPWMLKISSPDPAGYDSSVSDPFKSSVKLPPREPVIR